MARRKPYGQATTMVATCILNFSSRPDWYHWTAARKRPRPRCFRRSGMAKWFSAQKNSPQSIPRCIWSWTIRYDSNRLVTCWKCSATYISVNSPVWLKPICYFSPHSKLSMISSWWDEFRLRCDAYMSFGIKLVDSKLRISQFVIAFYCVGSEVSFRYEKTLPSQFEIGGPILSLLWHGQHIRTVYPLWFSKYLSYLRMSKSLRFESELHYRSLLRIAAVFALFGNN